ncbi:MAG: hypothetical protein ACI9B9_000302, partial [Halioglobus sp.]
QCYRDARQHIIFNGGDFTGMYLKHGGSRGGEKGRAF